MHDTAVPMPGASNNDVYPQVNKPEKKEEPNKYIYGNVENSKKKKQGNEGIVINTV